MGDNGRNSSSGIIFLFLMFVFFSFIHGEKERQITKTTIQLSDISNPNISSQAIRCPTISAPGINIFWTYPLNVKFSVLAGSSSREFIFNNLLSSSFSSCQLAFHSNNPIVSLFHLQKVPEQGNEDDVLSIT